MADKDHEDDKPNSMAALTDEQILTLWDETAARGHASDVIWFAALLQEVDKRSLQPRTKLPSVTIDATIDLTKGQWDPDILEADRSLIKNATEDPWVRPDCERDDPSYVCCYGQSFDGYAFAEKNSIRIADLANSTLHQYEKSGSWTGDFVTLRCCLYFEWRRVHHVGGLYDSTWETIRSLFKAVCAAYKDEATYHQAQVGRGESKTAIYDGVEFPDAIRPQLERVLGFVKILQPSGVYRPSGIYKGGGRGMNQLRAARQPQSDHRRAEGVFLIIEPRPSRNGAVVKRAGPNHTERYDLPSGSDEMEALLRAIMTWHEEARKNRIP